MRILFDAYWYVAGPPSQRHVLREMIAHWREEFPQDEVGLVVRAKHAEAARAELPDDVSLFASKAYPQALLASFRLPILGRRWNADVIVAHNYAPRFRRGVSAVFLHDVLFKDHPEWFTRAERLYFGIMPLLAPRADVVFTSSSTEADRIRRRTRSRRVVPVGIGMSRELTEAAPDGKLPSIAVDLRPSHYVLAVGRLNIRKNLARVIAACIRSGAISRERPLVVVGSGDGRADSHTPELQAAMDSGAVLFAGYVSDGQLRWLYENASCMVFASLGEGFGMPPVEAAFFGTDVVVSDLPVFRETVGQVAVFVDPSSEDSIGAGVLRAIASHSKGITPTPDLEWGEQFDWTTTVRNIRTVVEELESDERGTR